MLLKCQIVKLIAITVIIIHNVIINHHVYCTDTGGGSHNDSFSSTQLVSELKNRLDNVDLNDSNKLSTKLLGSLVALSTEIENLIKNDFLVNGQISITQKSDQKKVIVNVKNTSGGGVTSQITYLEGSSVVNNHNLTIEVKLDKDLGNASQENATRIANGLKNCVEKTLETKLGDNKEKEKLNKIKESDNFKSLVEPINKNLSSSDKLKKALDKDAVKTKIAALLSAEFGVTLQKDNIKVDKAQNKLLITLLNNCNDNGDKGSATVTVKGIEILIEVKVKKDNNDKIAKILEEIINEAGKSESSSSSESSTSLPTTSTTSFVDGSVTEEDSSNDTQPKESELSSEPIVSEDQQQPSEDSSTDSTTPHVVTPEETTEESESDTSVTTTGTTTPTLLDLDVSKKESTNEFDFSQDGALHTYEVKPGYKFKKVFKDDKVLWESKDDSTNAVKVVLNYSQLGNILISVYYDSSNSFQLTVASDRDPKETLDSSTEVSDSSTILTTVDTSSGLLVDHLKLLTLDEQGQSVDDKTKFDVQDLTELFNYTFNDGSRCTELNYDNKTVWKYDPKEHGIHYPTSVLFNTKKSFLYIESGNEYQYSFVYYNNEWKQVSGHRDKPPEPLEPDKLEFVTLESDGTTKDLDPTKYDKHSYSNVTTFRFKSNVRCCIVRYEGHTLWTHDQQIHGDDFPSVVTLNVYKNFLLVDSFDKYRYLYTRHKHWNQELGYVSTMSKHLDFNKVTVVTLDLDDSPKENDVRKYELNKTNVVCIYRFKEGAKCTEVKYGDQHVWKYNPVDHCYNYPTKITFNKNNNIVLIESSNKYCFYYGYYNDEWRLLPLGYRLRSAKKPEQYEKPSAINFKVITSDINKILKENDTAQYDIDDTQAFYSFKFKSDSKCTAFKYNDIVLWNFDRQVHGPNYPTKITFNKNNGFLTIESDEFYQYYYSFYDNYYNLLPFGNRYKPQESSLPKSTSKESLDQQQPSEDSSTDSTTPHVVTPEETTEHKLKIITQEADGKTKENDATKYDLKQYGKIYKVEFKDDAKCIKVILDNDILYEYQQGDEDQYPKEIYFYTETGCAYIRFFKTSLIPFYGDEWKSESDDTNAKKVTSSKFNITTDGSTNPNDNTKFDETQEGSFVKCQFKTDAKCTEVRYDNKTVWKYKQGKYPKALYFHKLIKVVFFEFDNDVFILKRYDLDNCSWKSEKLEKGSFDPRKLHVQTPDSDECTTEDDSSVTDRINLGPIVYYSVKYDANYFNFKYDKEIIICFDDDNNEFKFKGIFFLSDPRKILVHFEDQCLYINNPNTSQPNPISRGSSGSHNI